MKKVLCLLFAVILLASAIGHVIAPDMYSLLIPSFIPEWLANGLSFITEALVGVALLIPKYRRLGGIGFMVLMIAFLPIHIWDFTKEAPFIGSKTVAIIRIVIQIALIWAGYYIYKNHPKNNQ